MYMCVYVCVHLCECICVFMCVCTCACMCTCACVCGYSMQRDLELKRLFDGTPALWRMLLVISQGTAAIST